VSAFAQSGPPGTPRGVGFGILLFILTLGFYGWYWVFKTQEEMKQHTGDGLGGVVGLVIGIVVAIVNFFVIPSEVGKMYKGDGQTAPVSGWLGLWVLLPLIGVIVWYVKVQGSLNRYWRGKREGAPAAAAAAPV